MTELVEGQVRSYRDFRSSVQLPRVSGVDSKLGKPRLHKTCVIFLRFLTSGDLAWYLFFYLTTGTPLTYSYRGER